MKNFLNFCHQGQEQLEKKKYEEAIHYYTQAIRCHPGLEGYNGRAVALTQLKRYEEALSDYHQCIILEPKNVQLHLQCMEIFYLSKKYDLALQECNEIIKRVPKFGYFYSNRAIIYMLTRKYSRALKDFETAQKLCYDLQNIHFYKGSAYLKLKKYKDAIREFTLQIERSPGSDVFRQRAEVLVRTNQLELALEDLDHLIALEPGNEKNYMARSVVHFLMENYPASLADINLAASLREMMNLMKNKSGKDPVLKDILCKKSQVELKLNQ